MKLLKRLAIVVAVALGGTLVAASVMWWTTFGAVKPLPETATFDGGAFMIPLGYVAVFAIPTQQAGHILLVDCGDDVDAKKIHRVLADKKLTVDAILVTHGHPDHVQGCTALGAPVYALAAEVPGIVGDVPFYEGPLPKLAGPHHLGVKVARELQDNDVFDVAGKTVRVFAVPGHTKGSAAYLVDKVLYLGDAASAGKGGGVIPAPRIFSDDVALDVVSLKALAGKLQPDEVKSFAFSHSAPLDADLAKLAAVEP